MSNSITPAPSGLETLTRTIFQNFDANKDGQFSVDEFSSFLNSFLRGVTGGQAANAAVPAVNTTPLFSALGGATPSGAGAGFLPPCMPGWDSVKWDNPAHTTIKYVAGRIMARHTPSEWLDAAKREEILAEFRAAGLSPTASGKDRCDFNDGAGPIDIVQGASEGGRAWQWLPVN